MPKTKDAFALREVIDGLAQISAACLDDERGYLPTYAGRNNTSEDGQNKYNNSNDCRVEEILLAYLDGGKIKHVDSDIFSEFEKKYAGLNLCKARIAQTSNVVKRIGKHVVILQSYEKKLLDAILKSGLTDELKRKGNRVKNLLADYDWLIELFTDYEVILQNDREQTRGKVNRLYRKEFGGRLRQARIAKNMTVEEVANKINLTRVGYGYYELGQRDPPPGAIYILAQMFDVSADWLLGLTKK